jgi:nucleoside-diphosphate-sugar epimerase
MNILITGATGFVGKNLIKMLSYSNIIHVLIRPTTKIEKHNVKDVFVFNDNIEELSNYLIENRIEGLIHLASLYIAQHQSQQTKDLVLSNIYLGTALLEASVKAKVKWFLNTGTIWQNYNVPDKSDEYNPVNLYAATKQAFMDLAKFYIETSKLKFCTLKLCDTYGPNDTRNKIFALLKKNAETRVSLDMSLGEQKLDILYIDDVISGFTCLIERLHCNNRNTASEYVLSSGKQYTLKQLSKIFEDVTHQKLDINWGGRAYREREVMKPYIGNILPKWSPKVTLEKGIIEFMGL